MGLLDRFRNREDQQSDDAGAECPHTALVPRWDSADDIGHHERAVAFHCEGCGRDFSGEEGRRLLH